MLGIKYLLLMARKYSLPLTILLGIGTNTGSHSGSSPLPSYLNHFSNSFGLITVVAGGNETRFGHHYLGHIAAEEEYEEVELRVGSNETGFTMELWARSPNSIPSPLPRPRGTDPRLQYLSEEHRLTFLLEDTVIYLSYSGAESATGSQLIMMRFKIPLPASGKSECIMNCLYRENIISGSPRPVLYPRIHFSCVPIRIRL